MKLFQNFFSFLGFVSKPYTAIIVLIKNFCQ
nr:MAG TPA: hypothetical protein [Caudoviricetes sp.]